MKTGKTLRWWQWETLLVTMGGYALYYMIRKNLSIAMSLLGDIGVSKVQLGAFLTCGGIVYGVGRFLNGIVADRNSARKVMAIGLFICSFVNVLFGRAGQKGALSKGGMDSKLMAVRTAVEAGINTVIANGTKPHVLEAIFSGRDVGTYVPGRAL